MTRRGPARKAGGDRRGPATGEGGDTRVWTDTGSDRCRIVKFEFAKDSTDEDLIGILSIRPLMKKARTLKLIVRQSDDLQFLLGAETVELEALQDTEWKQLICTASWGSPSGKSGEDEGDDKKSKSASKKKERELRTLSLETQVVAGTIESIEGDVIMLKAKPTGDHNWLDAEARDLERGVSGDSKREKKPVPRKLQIKILENLTKFEGGKSGSLELGDFQVGQEVEATVVCGRKTGVMLTLTAPGVEGRTDAPKGGEEKPRDTGGGRTRRGPTAKPPKGGGI